MSLTFNGQYLVEKLAKLDSSQLSIQTLSHWCRFHRTKAKQVVETWAGQFHCSPREQRLAFLFLANDILQNSRRKGAEFVVEFWKVLPNAFRDVVENGAQSEKNAAERMIGIWEERRVFDIQGKLLKEELMGQTLEKSNREGETLSRKLIGVGEEKKIPDIQGKVLKNDEPMGRCIEKSNGNGDTLGRKPRQSVGSMVDKIVLSYEIVYDGPVDEEALLRKCGKAVAFVDKVVKEIGSDNSTGLLKQPELNELQGHGILRESIEQLSAAESSRANLVSRLKEALQEQELKLDQIRLQLQAARIRSEQVENICERLKICKRGDLPTEQKLKETSIADIPPSFTPETLVAGGDDKGRPAPIIMHTPQGPPFSRNSSNMEEDIPNSAAAAVAAELGASIFVSNALASEDNIENQQNHASTFVKCPSGKRTKLANGAPSYIQSQQLASEPLPYIPHPEPPHLWIMNETDETVMVCQSHSNRSQHHL